MTEPTPSFDDASGRLKWPLRLTHAGLWAERLVRAFWRLTTVLLDSLAAIMAALQDMLPLKLSWGTALFAVAGIIAFTVLGVRRFHRPTRAEAVDRAI